MRASATRCPPYRGTNISRYTPTSQRPARSSDRRYGTWWPKNYVKTEVIERTDNENTPSTSKESNPPPPEVIEENPEAPEQVEEEPSDTKEEVIEDHQETSETSKVEEPDPPEKMECVKIEKIVTDNQVPSTSTATADIGFIKKRLYSTVLSTQPINLTNVRIPQKTLIPGLLKLNPKIVLPAARIRAPNVDNKFEELEKEALEQYKASDESIDTKFSELEKQAVEQYSTSNSNTSCSSGNSAEKRGAASKQEPNNRKHHAKFRKDNTVDSVVIYSQNFPDLSTKGQTSSMMNLKNFHTPPRGEKKEQTHRSSKNQRNIKSESQRAASDTDYEAKERKTHKGSMRWTLHVIPPKKRHLSVCASDTSDEDLEETGTIKDAAIKNRVGSKLKMSAHGGGDLYPILRKLN